MQGPAGIRAPSTAEAGTTIEIDVQGGAAEVEVGLSGSGASSKIPVGPDGKASVPVPNEPGRFLLIVTVGPPPPGSASIQIISTN